MFDSLWFFRLLFYEEQNSLFDNPPFLTDTATTFATVSQFLPHQQHSVLTGKKIILCCVVKQSLWVHQAHAMTCFCSLINKHEVHDAYGKYTRVCSILNKTVTAVKHWTKEWVLVFRSWIVHSKPYFGLTSYKEKSHLMLLSASHKIVFLVI